MSQDFTDDCFASAHAVQTDMQNIENNFAALKSAFSGAAAPSDLIAGMVWYDTTTHILKIRNEANTAWQSVWDLANNKPVITNLSAEITGAMIAAAIKDAVAGTASLRTLGTGAEQALPGNTDLNGTAHTGDVTGTTALTIGASKVAQGMLKTSQGSVSVVVEEETKGITASLPGGEYGFRIQVKSTAVRNLKFSGLADAVLTAAYVSPGAQFENGPTGGNETGYAQERYVTASGEVFWIFILRNKITKEIWKVYQAPDHPCFGNGGNPLLFPHPFGSYDPTKHEIIIINPSDEEVYNMEQACIVNDETKPDRDLIEVVLQDYEIDEELKTPWPRKEVTVGLPRGINWKNMPDGSKVIPVKKRIPKPSYITTRKLWKK